MAVWIPKPLWVTFSPTSQFVWWYPFYVISSCLSGAEPMPLPHLVTYGGACYKDPSQSLAHDVFL